MMTDRADMLAALAWQVEMGADEAILDAPVDRFAPAEPAPDPMPEPEAAPDTRPQDLAEVEAARAADLNALRAVMAAFEGCALKRGARNLVFADGNPDARVMIVGEAPGREEDLKGLPFVGRSGQLLDLMFAAIGLSRQATDPAEALYITNVLPWRPPQNRDPSSDEIAMMRPFLERHIALANPMILVPMGNPATKTLLQTATGITRMRGRWTEVLGRPTLPMFHPAALLRDPIKKREAWSDLRAIRARLEGT